MPIIRIPGQYKGYNASEGWDKIPPPSSNITIPEKTKIVEKIEEGEKEINRSKVSSYWQSLVKKIRSR